MFHPIPGSAPEFTLSLIRIWNVRNIQDPYLQSMEHHTDWVSFQDDYFFCGTLGKQFEQVGNAVPPLLGKAVGKSIVKTYKEKRKAELLSKYSVDELIEVVRAHAFDYKKIESERKIQNTNRN